MNTEQLSNLNVWTKLNDLAINYGFKIIFAIIIFLVGKWLAKLIVELVAKRMRNTSIDATVTQFVKNIAYYLLILIVVVVALSQLGIQTASFVAVIGAAGLAIGLALQGSLANFASGVLLVLFRPIKVGDFVEIAGVAGSVKEISILATTILSGDNKTITVTNASVMNNNIVNYSTQATRRIDMVVAVSYDSDIQQVKQELKALAAADERIMSDPAVTIGVLEFADSSINIVFRPWVNRPDYWPVYFDLHEKIKKRFDEVGISIPYPTMDVKLSKVTN